MTRHVASIICLLVAISAARAQLDCTPLGYGFPTHFNGGGGLTYSFAPSSDGLPEGTYDIAITITAASDDLQTIVIKPESNCTFPPTIRTLNVVNATTRQVRIAVQSNTESPPRRFRSISAFVTDTSSSGDVILTDLQTSGDVGTISATSLPGVNGPTFSYFIGGNLTGNITLLKRKSTQPFDQFVSMQITGNMLGGIDGPDTSSNWLYTIDQITVGGNIGAPGSPVTINSRNGINSITAKSIYAAINANAYPSSGGENYFRLIATIVEYPAPSSSVGVISGSINAGSVKPQLLLGNPPGGIFTTGDFAASLTLSQPFDGNILVSRKFSGSINLPDKGLVGQIVTNNFNNSGTPASFWTGSVTINGSALSSVPFYTNTPASIGGGAAGAIGVESGGNPGFRLHKEGCLPASGSTIVGYGIDPTSIIIDPPCTNLVNAVYLRMYGPVEFVPGASAPYVTVEQKSGSSWVAVSWTPQVSIVADNTQRVLKVTANGGAWPLGEFRIKPVLGKIRRAMFLSSPTPLIPDFEYLVKLTDGCGLDLLQAFDLDHNGALGMGDVAAWLGDQTDLNRDNQVNNTDLEVLLSAIGTAPDHPVP